MGWASVVRSTVLGLMVAIVLLAACGGRDDRAQSLAAAAMRTYQGAGSVRLNGRFTSGGKVYTFDLAVSRPNRAQGTAGLNGYSVELIVDAERVFVRGHDFIAAQVDERTAAFMGSRWLLLSDRQMVRDFQDFISPKALAAQPMDRSPRLRVQEETTVRGIEAVKLGDANTSLYVASGDQPLPLRIETAPAYVTPAGWSDVMVDFMDYDTPVNVEDPGEFIDPANPNTLPPLLVVAGVNQDASCDSDGCPITALIRNDGGPGAADALFKVLSADGRVLASCVREVPALRNNEARSLSCTVGSAELASYFASSRAARVKAQVEISRSEAIKIES